MVSLFPQGCAKYGFYLKIPSINTQVSKKTHPEAWAMHIKVFIQKETMDKLENQNNHWVNFKVVSLRIWSGI